jgi:uncharacterized protein YjgD (DUF1641 family)
VRAIRNLLTLAKLLGSMDPELLHHVAETLPQAIEQSSTAEPPSLLTLLGRFRSKESRRVLAAGATLLEGVGRGLNRGAK